MRLLELYSVWHESTSRCSLQQTDVGLEKSTRSHFLIFFLLQYLLDKLDLVVSQTSYSPCRSSPAKAADLSPRLGNIRGAPPCREIPREFIIPSSWQIKKRGRISLRSEKSTNLHHFSLSIQALFLSGFKERWKLWVNDLTVKVLRLWESLTPQEQRNKTVTDEDTTKLSTCYLNFILSIRSKSSFLQVFH